MANALAQRSEQMSALELTLKGQGTFKRLVEVLPVSQDKAEQEAKRLIANVLNAVGRTPQLLKCTPVSIAQGMLQAAELQLEISGPLGEAYLIPRYDKKSGGDVATFQVGYKGIKELAHRTGKVNSYYAHAVYPTDVFDYQLGTSVFINHKPDYVNASDTQTPVAVYAVAKLSGGETDIEVWSWGRILQHRDKYRSTKSEYSPWDTAIVEMAKKTVMRALGKRLPLSPQTLQALNQDEMGEVGVDQMLPGIELTTQARMEHLKNRLGIAQEDRDAGPELVSAGEETTREPGEDG